MKIKTNIIAWEKHYHDYLVDYYYNFNKLLATYNEETVSYIEFVNFCFRNTKKTLFKSPGLFAKELRAPLN